MSRLATWMLRQAVLFRTLALAALTLVLVMSLRPAVSTGGVPHADKVLHLIAYAGLAGLMRLGWPRLWGGWVLAGLLAYGVGIEIAQHSMALGRTGSLADAVANTLGIMLGLAGFALLRHFATD